MSAPPEEGPYYCPFCEPGETDLTGQVQSERDGQMTVLRGARRSGPWSVIVTCPRGHEVVVEGQWPSG